MVKFKVSVVIRMQTQSEIVQNSTGRETHDAFCQLCRYTVWMLSHSL